MMMGGSGAVVDKTAGFIIVLDNVINLRIIIVNQILSAVILTQLVYQKDYIRIVVCHGDVVFGD